MPSRSIGWSSTARTRIKLGSVLMPLFRSLAEKLESGACRGSLVSDGAWNIQLYFRASSEFAPDLQLRSYLRGSLADSRQAPVPGASTAFNDAWVNALSIVAET